MIDQRVIAEPTISEPLTWAEICARYPDEWVALVEIDWINDTDFDIRSARVAGHGKTAKEPLDQAHPLRARYEEIGHFFTGPVRALDCSFLLWKYGPLRRAALLLSEHVVLDDGIRSPGSAKVIDDTPRPRSYRTCK